MEGRRSNICWNRSSRKRKQRMEKISHLKSYSLIIFQNWKVWIHRFQNIKDSKKILKASRERRQIIYQWRVKPFGMQQRGWDWNKHLVITITFYFFSNDLEQKWKHLLWNLHGKYNSICYFLTYLHVWHISQLKTKIWKSWRGVHYSYRKISIYHNNLYPPVSKYQLPTPSSCLHSCERAYTGVQLGRDLAITSIVAILFRWEVGKLQAWDLRVFINKVLLESIFFSVLSMAALTLQ